MNSPARRHFLRVSAAKASAQVTEGQPLEGSTQYELMLMKLAADKRRLKEIQSIERKIEVKKELIPEYQDWVSGSMAGNGAQDDVLVTVLVWMIDVGDFERAMPLIEYSLKHNLQLPEQYARDLPTLIVDEVSDSALKAKEFNPEVLIAVEQLTQGFDMPDQAKAKLYKALGTHVEPFDKKDALDYLVRADTLNSKSGVRTAIKRLQKELSQ